MDKNLHIKFRRMKINVTFLGNESPYMQVINDLSNLHLAVCEKVSWKVKKYFGSSYDFASRNNIQIKKPCDYVKKPSTTDLIVVSGYSKLIPKKIINLPRMGIINIHQSLLPAYKGRHPLNWAIINGEKYTGVTIHKINEAYDDGEIIFQERVRIASGDTIMQVYRKTIEKGKKLINKLIRKVAKDGVTGSLKCKYPESYFPPRRPKDGKIDWNEPALKIKDLVRALAEPYPGAYFYYKGQKITIEKARVADFNSIDKNIGKLIQNNDKVLVQTGSGVLEILKTRNFNCYFDESLNRSYT